MTDETTETGGPTLWTREDLELLSVEDLREMAHAENLLMPGEATKAFLIDTLLAHQAEQAEE
jgi:hypothetical protein